MAAPATSPDNPFSHAEAYRAAGWIGTIPIPLGVKWPPPKGFTGEDGQWPSRADIHAWQEEGPHNIALRLPPSVIALDVDVVEAFAALLEKVGPLPPTWRAHSGGGRLGHLYYRLPAGVTSHGWGAPCEGVDLLRYGHRYSVVWPSVHPSGTRYRWVAPPEPTTARNFPRPGDLPELPAEWVAHLSGERRAEGTGSGGTLPAPGELGSPIPEGEHDATITAYVWSLRHRVSETEAIGLARARGRDCVPPTWTDAMSDAKVRYAYRREVEPEPIWPAWEEALAADAAQAELGGSAEVVPGGHGRRLLVTTAGHIPMRSSRWLWATEGASWLPLGALTLLGGREGIGKSTWAYWIAAQVTRGALPGDLLGEPRAVVVCATEDAWAQTVVPRLAAAGADLERVLRVEAAEHGAVGGLTLPVDVAALGDVCRSHDVALVLLDPLLGTISGHLDSHKDSDVRRALEPISRLAHDVAVTVVGLIHQNKSTSGDLLTRLMASRAFAAVARAVLVCAEEKSEEEGITSRTFLFGQEKNSLAALVRESVRYEIEGVNVGHDAELKKDIWSSRIRILDVVQERVSEVVARQERDSERGPGRPPSKREEAMVWLRTFLAGRGGRAPRDQIVAAAETAGFSESTVERAKRALGLSSERAGGEVAIWSWTP